MGRGRQKGKVADSLESVVEGFVYGLVDAMIGNFQAAINVPNIMGAGFMGSAKRPVGRPRKAVQLSPGVAYIPPAKKSAPKVAKQRRKKRTPKVEEKALVVTKPRKRSTSKVRGRGKHGISTGKVSEDRGREIDDSGTSERGEEITT